MALHSIIEEEGDGIDEDAYGGVGERQTSLNGSLIYPSDSSNEVGITVHRTTCQDIRLNRKKVCVLAVVFVMLVGAGMLGPINFMLHDPLFLPVAIMMSLFSGGIVWVVSVMWSFSVTKTGVEQFFFGETEVVPWAEIRSVHRGGIVYIIRGRSLMTYVMFPSLFWVEDRESVTYCINEYAPKDSPLRKYFHLE